MAKRTFQHNVYIQARERLDSSKLKSLKEGTIIEFSYQGKNISDKNPLVMLLWNDYKKYKIHGVNLNYLTHRQVINIFNKLSKQGLSIDSNYDNVDETSAYRNIVKDPYTRVMLPTYNDAATGNLGKETAHVRMENIYNKVLKSFLKREDIYRTYSTDKVRVLSVVEMNMKKLVRL